MEKAVAKNTKNPVKSLSKRQKRIFVGLCTGVLSLVIIVLIVCLWPRKEKGKQSIYNGMDAGDNSSETSHRHESGIGGQAGKILGAKTLVPNPHPASDSQDKSEEPGESSETLTETEKTFKKTSEEAAKVTPEVTETKSVIAPEKEIKKKDTIVSFKTCADYQSALAEALKKTSKKNDLETLYAKVQELCKGAFTTQTLVDHVKQQFESRKVQIFASERPTNNDLSELMVLQSNLKKLDNNYKPEKTLEQEFCDHFSSRFTVPFGKVEADPNIVDGKECALESQKYFHAARTIGKNNHPAYAHEDLQKYVTAKVEELLSPLNADVMKYIQILRYLNPDSIYAFPDCNDLAALQNKMAERRTAAFNSVNLTNGPLSMNIIKILDNDQVESLIERCSDLLKNPPIDQFERYAAESNKNLLELVKLARGMDDTAQAWMNSGFHVRKSPEFKTFASKHLTMAARSKLQDAMKLASGYHKYLFIMLKDRGFSDDADIHQIEDDLARFLNGAFKSTSETALDTVINFTSADTVESARGYVNFFEGIEELGELMVKNFWRTKDFRNKHAGFYRLIHAQLRESKVPKVVQDVNMNAPKDVKEWFERVNGAYSGDKLAPVFDIAQIEEDITAAKNDLLPDSAQKTNGQMDSLYRPVAVLMGLKERYKSILKQLRSYLKTHNIQDIRTALDNMESYSASHPDFYSFLKCNQKALEYSLRGYNSDFAIQEVTDAIKRSNELSKQTKLYDAVSLIISIFDKEPGGCIIQSDGAIVCENKFMEEKLLELEKDVTWEGHRFLLQFLSEARKFNSVNDVRNLARTFLAAEKAACNAESAQLHVYFGDALIANIYY